MINNRNVNIITDADGNKIALINDIRFKGKRNINWDDVAEYLKVTDRSALYKCCNHKLKTHFGYCLYKGYRWEWA